jgi:hypothetical protein
VQERVLRREVGRTGAPEKVSLKLEVSRARVNPKCGGGDGTAEGAAGRRGAAVGVGTGVHGVQGAEIEVGVGGGRECPLAGGGGC